MINQFPSARKDLIIANTTSGVTGSPVFGSLPIARHALESSWARCVGPRSQGFLPDESSVCLRQSCRPPQSLLCEVWDSSGQRSDVWEWQRLPGCTALHEDVSSNNCMYVFSLLLGIDFSSPKIEGFKKMYVYAHEKSLYIQGFTCVQVCILLYRHVHIIAPRGALTGLPTRINEVAFGHHAEKNRLYKKACAERCRSLYQCQRWDSNVPHTISCLDRTSFDQDQTCKVFAGL